LKGAETVVASAEGVKLSPFANAALATAGTGDVLTGITGAFLAKGMEPLEAAAAAAAAQQRASIEAPQRAGLVAGDLVDALPRALAR
jgi:NAD(P)H-hydrate epimerase